jgi:hypothetical protein
MASTRIFTMGFNWMMSTEPQDDGVAEDIQESTEAALTATSWMYIVFIMIYGTITALFSFYTQKKATGSMKEDVYWNDR